ncbi:hypothetical protein M758_2G069700, partial [Ceratodon purpureus]
IRFHVSSTPIRIDLSSLPRPREARELKTDDGVISSGRNGRILSVEAESRHDCRPPCFEAEISKQYCKHLCGNTM